MEVGLKAEFMVIPSLLIDEAADHDAIRKCNVI